jgi:hypothetical protein
MIIRITRDSVCAGDDVDPDANSRKLVVRGELTIEQLVTEVVNAADLPRIEGGRATWCISSNVPLAVVAQQWARPELVNFIQPKIAEVDVSNADIWVHISYFAQEDPEVVCKILRTLKLRSR